MDYEVVISGLCFNATHGVYKEEKEKEQLFKVDISLLTSLDSSFSDDISYVINYEEIFTEVKKVIDSEPVNLIETLAKQIIDTMEKFNPLKVTVTIHKPETLLSKSSDNISVSLSKSFG